MIDPNDEQLELGQFIPLHYHHVMLGDEPRMKSFRETIEKLVPIGGKVLELGGGTGALSFFAAQRASKVWCVERNPNLATFARKTLPLNRNADRIELVEADAMDYLPPEPVDAVICEMLHTALIREKQVRVLDSFKHRYLKKFGPPLPLFIPDTSLLAVQAVEQGFVQNGYYAPMPVFQVPGSELSQTKELSDLKIYATVQYAELLPLHIRWRGIAVALCDGNLNALRFVTKNVIGIFQDEERWTEWHTNYLVLPIANPVRVQKGDWIDISFGYDAGASIASLEATIEVAVTPSAYA